MSEAIFGLAVPNPSSKQTLPKAPVSLQVLHDPAEVSGSGVNALILDCGDVEGARRFLREVRRNPKTSAMPVFLVGVNESPLAADDGVVADWWEAQAQAKPVLAGLSLLPKVEDQDHDDRLLRFLFARPQTMITPVCSYESPVLFRYPLAEMFAEDHQDVSTWLGNLTGRKLLEEGELVSRVRLCPDCSKAHLNFLDRCPNCHSADIQQKYFLHCFTCANVAPQEDFYRKGALECGKCGAQLRHIGSDYDRALENYTCAGCHHSFVEPEVVATCLDCGMAHPPSELEKREIRRLCLSEQGRLAVRAGNLRSVYSVLEKLNYVVPEQFLVKVDWMTAICKRHKEIHYSILQLDMENVPELAVKLGRGKVVMLMETFAERLRQLIRLTDVSTRLTENRLSLLLPQTNGEQTEVLRKRILALSKDAELPQGTEFKVTVKRYSYPADYLEGETAELILRRLGAE